MNEYQRLEDLRRRLPELLELEELRLACRGVADVCVETEVKIGPHILPVYSFAIGSTEPDVPRVAFVGGVHGLERIGTNIIISYLKQILELVQWDKGLQYLLGKCRLLFYPVVNPGGMFGKTRSNPAGVDLMRNSPVNAEVKPNVFLVGGHRISSRLPWYRGPADMPMEKEALALEAFVRREIFPAHFSLVLDLHSGFGLIDRLWFPYASSRRPFDLIELMYALKVRLDRSLPNHFYLMEPQASQYVTHGDLWDHFYLEQKKTFPGNVFLPLTLEMGSWLWVKKNPRQLFSALGMFNPMLPHRMQRTLRRHLALLDFCLRATVSHDNWAGDDRIRRDNSKSKAIELWY